MGEKHWNYGKPLTDECREKLPEHFKGEGNPSAKLNNEKVREIKFTHLVQGILSLKQIGELYGVTKTTISDIKHDRIWKHIIN